MVVMASPGMMQSGFSRELFEMWCSDKRNGLMMPGYSVAGTLAHQVMSEPKEIVTSAGDRVEVNLSIDYISFSAHSDFQQTRDFISAIRPVHVVLVHGGEEGMGRLKEEMEKLYKPQQTAFYMPGNCQSVNLRFHGEKIAKVVGSLARDSSNGAPLSGFLLKRDFKYTLMAPSDLKESTQLSSTSILHRAMFHYAAPLPHLLSSLRALFALEPLQVEPLARSVLPGIDSANSMGSSSGSSQVTLAAGASDATSTDGAWRVHEAITLRYSAGSGKIALEWDAAPVNDMIADAVAATLLQLQALFRWLWVSSSGYQVGEIARTRRCSCAATVAMLVWWTLLPRRWQSVAWHSAVCAACAICESMLLQARHARGLLLSDCTIIGASSSTGGTAATTGLGERLGDGGVTVEDAQGVAEESKQAGEAEGSDETPSLSVLEGSNAQPVYGVAMPRGDSSHLTAAALHALEGQFGTVRRVTATDVEEFGSGVSALVALCCTRIGWGALNMGLVVADGVVRLLPTYC